MASTLNIKGTSQSTFSIGSANGSKLTIDASLLTANRTLKFPNSNGTTGQVLTTDGAGLLSWVSVATSAGGATSQIQFNNGGVFAGDANLTWNGTNAIEIGSSSGFPTVKGKDNTSTASTLEILGGNSTVSGNGGGIRVRGGTMIDGAGGAIAIIGSTAATTTSATRVGGTVSLTGGAGAPITTGTAGGGGGIFITSGAGGAGNGASTTSGSGGDITIAGGVAGFTSPGTSGSGGSIFITGGDASSSTVTANGGNLELRGGRAGGSVSGLPGYIALFTGGNTNLATTATERLRILANGAWSIGTGGTATGTLGQILASNGPNAAPAWTTFSGSAAGSTTQVQYNNAGSIAGSALLKVNSSSVFIGGAISTRQVGGDGGAVAILETAYPTTGAAVLNIIENGNDDGTNTFGIGFAKSRGTTIGSSTIVQNNDILGMIKFAGANGSNLNALGADIKVQVDGTPGVFSMPGRLVLSTTVSGATATTERLRISSAGSWGLAGANYGTTGQALVSNGSSSAPTWQTVTTTPGGSTTQIQFNNAGVFAGDANLTWDTTGILTVGSSLGSGFPPIIKAADNASAPPGTLELRGGNTVTGAQGGGVRLIATTPGTSGSGGLITLTSGNGFGTNQFGGGIVIQTGTGTGTGEGGDLVFRTSLVERLRIIGNGAWSIGTSGTATGTAGQSLVSNGSSAAPTWQDVTATPGGSTTQIQFNSSGSFGGDADLTWDSTTNTMTVGSNATPGIIQGPTASAGTNLLIKGGNSTSTGSSAGGVTVSAGTPINGDGGSVTITATPGIDPGDTGRHGGSVAITAGAADPSSGGLGSPGNISLTAGTSTGPGTTGGSVVLRGGAATAGAAGQVLISGGTASVAADGGQVSISGSNGVGTSKTGGVVTITAGSSTNAVAGPNVTITGGGSAAGNGGSVLLTAANGAGTNTAGGNITLTAGNGTTIGGGGNVTLLGGTSPSGTAGSIRVLTAATERLEILGNGAWEVGGSAGSATNVLTSNGSGGPPTWQAASTGGTPGGSTTQIQFNNAGAFGGDADLTWDSTTNTMTVGNPTTTGIIQAPANTANATGPQLLIRGGDAGPGNNQGGGLVLRAGTSTGSQTGGSTTIQGGFGGTVTSAGGAVSIQGIAGGTTSGSGGDVTVNAGHAASGALRGNAYFQGGTSTSANSSGQGFNFPNPVTGLNPSDGSVVMTGGTGSAAHTTGGIAYLQGGAGGSANTNGGDVHVMGGEPGATGNGTGGTVRIIAGRPGPSSGVGGTIIMYTGGSGGTVAPTERLRILANGAWSVGTAGTATGTSGQFLKSQGSSAVPVWADVSAASSSTNIAGGTTGQIPFQSGVSATTFDAGLVYTGASTQILTLGTATVGPTIQAITTTAVTTFTVKGATGSGVAGGKLMLTGGQGASGLGGGTVTVLGGAGGSSGPGGDVFVSGGNGTATGGAGGTVTINGGLASGVGNQGDIKLVSYTSATSAGSVQFIDGNTSSVYAKISRTPATSSFTKVLIEGGDNNAVTMDLQLSGGILGNGHTANLLLSGGVNTGVGGAATLSGGTATGATLAGGAITLTAGNGLTTGAGGAVTLSTGTSPSGTAGAMIFNTGTTASTERLRILNNGAWSVGTTGTATGTSGQVLASQGSASPPIWADAGYIDTPQNTQNTAYTLVLSDRGKHLYHTSATAHQYTIPANSVTAFPIGTTIAIYNDTGGGIVTVAINTDTLTQSGTGFTGSRTLAANAMASLLKIGATSWVISGVGIT